MPIKGRVPLGDQADDPRRRSSRVVGQNRTRRGRGLAVRSRLYGAVKIRAKAVQLGKNGHGRGPRCGPPRPPPEQVRADYQRPYQPQAVAAQVVDVARWF